MKKKKIDLKNYASWIIGLALVIVFSIISPRFRTYGNFITILKQVAVNGIMATGLALVLISGGIDLSTGNQLGLAGMICSLLTVNAGLPFGVAFLLTIVCGLLVGLINGSAICFTKMPPLIATLGMQYVIKGIAYLSNNGYTVYNLPNAATFIGQSQVATIPVSTFVMVAVLIVGWFFLNKTIFGRYFFAVGSNAEAARLSGINTTLVQISAYVLEGGLLAIAGVVLMRRLNSGVPNAGETLGMDVIIACVIGGISAAGGEGRIFGMLGGVLAMGVLANGMSVIGLTEYWQFVCKGAVLVVAVGIDSYRRYVVGDKKRHVIRSSAASAEPQNEI